MDFRPGTRTTELRKAIDDFMDRHVLPAEHRYREQVHSAHDRQARYRTPPIMRELKHLARLQGLWNLFPPGEHGPSHRFGICAARRIHGPCVVGVGDFQLLGARYW